MRNRNTSLENEEYAREGCGRDRPATRRSGALHADGSPSLPEFSGRVTREHDSNLLKSLARWDAPDRSDVCDRDWRGMLDRMYGEPEDAGQFGRISAEWARCEARTPESRVDNRMHSQMGNRIFNQTHGQAGNLGSPGAEFAQLEIPWCSAEDEFNTQHSAQHPCHEVTCGNQRNLFAPVGGSPPMQDEGSFRSADAASPRSSPGSRRITPTFGCSYCSASFSLLKDIREHMHAYHGSTDGRAGRRRAESITKTASFSGGTQLV